MNEYTIGFTINNKYRSVKVEDKNILLAKQQFIDDVECGFYDYLKDDEDYIVVKSIV